MKFIFKLDDKKFRGYTTVWCRQFSSNYLLEKPIMGKVQFSSGAYQDVGG